MIMLGFMETEKEFIKNWEKYRGAAGCLRYLAYWFLFGIIVIPLSPCLFFYAWESSGWLSFREICYTDKK